MIEYVRNKWFVIAVALALFDYHEIHRVRRAQSCAWSMGILAYNTVMVSVPSRCGIDGVKPEYGWGNFGTGSCSWAHRLDSKQISSLPALCPNYLRMPVKPKLASLKRTVDQQFHGEVMSPHPPQRQLSGPTEPSSVSYTSPKRDLFGSIGIT